MQHSLFDFNSLLSKCSGAPRCWRMVRPAHTRVGFGGPAKGQVGVNELCLRASAAMRSLRRPSNKRA